MLHNKFWQGFFAIGPIIMFVLFFIAYFIFIFTMISQLPELENSSNGMPPTSMLAGMAIFFAFLFLMLLSGLGSLIFYIMHAVQNPNLKDNNMLVVWILLFVFVSGIGQLIYWLVEIISKRKDPILKKNQPCERDPGV